MFAFLFNDDREDSDSSTCNKEDEKIVQIDTCADGTCFLHAVLKCCSPEYQELTKEKDRREFAYKIRRELIPMLRTENPKYPTLESVVEFVKKSLMDNKGKTPDSEEAVGIQFKEFLQTAYNFEYLSLPKQMKPLNSDYFDSLEEVYDHVSQYREYLVKFDDFLSKRDSSLSLPDFPDLRKKSGNRSEIQIEELNDEMKSFINALKDVQNAISKKVNEHHFALKKMLEAKLGNELYNPQNFGVPYIQAFLKGDELPKGLYSELPWNAYFFTANAGVLTRFAYYSERLIPGLEDLERILDNTRSFLGDMDIVPFIPSMIELNILVIDFNENQLVNEYLVDSSTEETQNESWVVISNNNNAHYYSCGYKDEEGQIITMFNKSDLFIQRILASKEHQGKIDWKKEIETIVSKSEIPEIPNIKIPEEIQETSVAENLQENLLKNLQGNISSKTIPQLKEIALQRGIKIPSSAKKSDILKLLS
jgi:hypothetical protein